MPIFPIGIGKVSNFINEKERFFLIESIKKNHHHEHPVISGNGSSTHNPDIVNKDIKNILGYSKISHRLYQQVNKYAIEYGIRYPLKIDNLWSNIQHSGSVLEEHYHPISIISGALYVNIDDSCSITFHNPNPHIYYTPINQRNSLNFEWQKCKIVNGDLILFPSWLKHGNHKEVNQMNDRMVISFNTHYG